MKYLLLIFLTTGMDVERFDSLKDCQFAAEAFTANFCGSHFGYFQQEKNSSRWFVCGKHGSFRNCATFTRDGEDRPRCRMLNNRDYHLSGIHRRPLFQYRAGCFQSTK